MGRSSAGSSRSSATTQRPRCPRSRRRSRRIPARRCCGAPRSLYVRAGKLRRRSSANAAVQLEPDNLEALALQGGILSSLGRDDEAILAASACAINPGQDPYLI